jgi:hypothetical protein
MLLFIKLNIKYMLYHTHRFVVWFRVARFEFRVDFLRFLAPLGMTGLTAALSLPVKRNCRELTLHSAPSVSQIKKLRPYKETKLPRYHSN